MNERGQPVHFSHMDELAFIPVEENKMNNDTTKVETDCSGPTDPGFDFAGGEPDMSDPEPQQACESDYDGGEGKVRYGNNRKHVTKAHAKARRKMANKSKQKNRK